MHYVRVIKNKIAELDTGSEYCNIPIDDSMIGTHFDQWIYKDGKFEIDKNWVKPDDTKQSDIEKLLSK